MHVQVRFHHMLSILLAGLREADDARDVIEPVATDKLSGSGTWPPLAPCINFLTEFGIFRLCHNT